MFKDDLNSRACDIKLHHNQMVAEKNCAAGKVTSTDNPYLMQQQRQTLLCVLLVLSDGHLHPHLFRLHPQWLGLTHLAPTASTTSVVFSQTVPASVHLSNTWCVCVCVCVCVCACMSACMCVCMCELACMHVGIHMLREPPSSLNFCCCC